MAKGNTTTKFSIVGIPNIHPVSSPHQYIGFRLGKPGLVINSKGAPIAKASEPPNKQLKGTANQRFRQCSSKAYNIMVLIITIKGMCDIPISSPQASNFLTCEIVPTKPRYSNNPPQTPLLVRLANRLPPLLIAKIKPNAPINNPNAIGCPPAATTIGISGISGP